MGTLDSAIMATRNSGLNLRRMVAFIAVLATIMLVLALEMRLVDAKGSKTSVSSAVVPRSKSSKRKGGMGDSPFFRNIMREIKISFSSELEGLTLQISRPNNAAVPLNLLGELTNFANVEFDNPKLLINLLAKLARKFAEKNSFTQLKIIYALHSVMQKVEEPAKNGWFEAISSLRREEDERTNAKFFSSELVEDAAAAAESAKELEAAELNRLYLEYVLDYLQIRAQSKPEIEELQRLVKDGEAVRKLAAQSDTPLTGQLVEAIKEDLTWAQGVIKSTITEENKANKKQPAPSKINTKEISKTIINEAKTTSSPAASKPTAATKSTAVAKPPMDIKEAAASSKAFAALKSSVEKSVGLTSPSSSSSSSSSANTNKKVDDQTTASKPPPAMSEPAPKAAAAVESKSSAQPQPATAPKTSTQSSPARPTLQSIGKKAMGKITPADKKLAAKSAATKPVASRAKKASNSSSGTKKKQKSSGKK